MDLLKSKYPIIRNIYYDYLQSDEYAKNPIQLNNSEKLSNSTDKAIRYAQNNNVNGVTDTILTAAVDCELSGFILGFTYALNLIKESEVLKEFAQ